MLRAFTKIPLRSLWPAFGVTICAFLLAIPRLVEPVGWTPDALLYQAQVLELRGESDVSALRSVSSGTIAAARLRLESAYVRSHPGQPYHVGDPRWMLYTAKFYRRRWVVPILGAALFPWLGDRSLYVVTITGFVVYAPLLFLFLRRRFSAAASTLATVACIALPMFRDADLYPGTDTWAVALETATLLAGLLVLTRSSRWLPLWVGCMAALALTRDSTVVPLAAAAWLLIRHRSQARLMLLFSGVAAALPPVLVFGAPYQRELAFTLDGFNIPRSARWSVILPKVPGALASMIHEQIYFLLHHPVTLIVFSVGLVWLFRPQTTRDPLFLAYSRAAAAAAIILVYVLPQIDKNFRFPIDVTPLVAVGVAGAADALLRREWRPARSSDPDRYVARSPVAARATARPPFDGPTA